ncbi:MAG TPA: CHRD domain-containing protein [Candidatus Dormibacteraeota bacterium]|nr:CHRD domain-containing protein [Candidatus Dormibacteraeota bacterium]
MRRLLAIASVLVVSVFTTASATASRQGPAIANLTGTQEVITTGTSTPGTSLASGLATFRLSEDGQALRYRLSVSHLTGAFAAHIHLNGAGVNGPVVVFLFNSAQPTGEVNGLLSQGTIRATDFVGPLFGHPFSELLTDIRNGDAYVNVHTLPNHPGGEIRGRVLANAGEDGGFAAHLTGTQEVITTSTSAPGTSLATGMATFQLSEDGHALRYRLTVSHLTGAFAAHIHLNGAGVNGPVVVPLFNSAVPTGEVNGLLSQGTITAASLVGPLFGHPFSELLTDIRSGDAYVNVHTLPSHPGGEIRGQVVSGDEGFKASLTGTGEVITSGSSTPGTSLATGHAIFWMDENGRAVHFRLEVHNITGVFASHIHLNGSGVNGPVVVFLFSSATPTGTVNGLLSQGTFTAADFKGPLAGHPLAELLTDIRSGDAYVNVHTLPNHPGGEIRGQIIMRADQEGD